MAGKSTPTTIGQNNPVWVWLIFKNHSDATFKNMI
jgi:hypothetical protein